MPESVAPLEKLKNCPMCGHEAGRYWKPNNQVCIGCTDCGIQTAPYNNHCKWMAIAAWNKRAEELLEEDKHADFDRRGNPITQAHSLALDMIDRLQDERDKHFARERELAEKIDRLEHEREAILDSVHARVRERELERRLELARKRVEKIRIVTHECWTAGECRKLLDQLSAPKFGLK